MTFFIGDIVVACDDDNRFWGDWRVIDAGLKKNTRYRVTNVDRFSTREAINIADLNDTKITFPFWGDFFRLVVDSRNNAFTLDAIA